MQIMQIMINTIALSRLASLAAGVLLLTGAAARAQDYPDRPIRVIVPFTAATPLDVIARAVAPKVGEVLKQSLVIENIPGAGNVIGIQTAARARPDGYTMLMVGQSASAITPFVFTNPPYSLEKQFTPVHFTASFVFVLTVNAQLPANNLQELIALAKQKPDGLFYGTTGPGAGSNIVTLQFLKKAGIKITAVNYKGGGDILTALQRNDVQLYMSVPQSAILGVQSGRVRAIGTTANARHRDFPNVPTFIEQGVNMIAKSWYGMVAPAGTPEVAVNRMNAAMNTAIKSPEVIKSLLNLGFEVEGGSAAEFARFMREEQAELKPVIVEAGIKGD